MSNLQNITNQMNILETEISRQQKYISTHGVSNDKGEFDVQWEQYKEDAQYNLNKWDSMKVMRDTLR